MLAFEVQGLSKGYKGVQTLTVLQNVHLTLKKGEAVALLGVSGSGKSTFLNLLGLLDRPDSGELRILGHEVQRLTENQRAEFRLRNLGFVFQFHHLIPELTALENVELPASIAGKKKSFSRKRAGELLELMGLKERLSHFPWQLSGGENQRVAIARALMNEPQILLTDEATGNLDRERAEEVTQLLLRVQRETGALLLSVTHDEDLASFYDRRLRLKDGQIWDLLRPGGESI